MPAKDEPWRQFLTERGFKEVLGAARMWMCRDNFYIRRSRPQDPGNFATCSGSMIADGAFHPTIDAAYATYVAWLLTTSHR